MTNKIALKIIGVAVLAVTNISFAGEDFEINKENCNLPVKEIRKRLNDVEAQQDVLDKCMEKAADENWIKKDLAGG